MLRILLILILNFQLLFNMNPRLVRDIRKLEREYPGTMAELAYIAESFRGIVETFASAWKDVNDAEKQTAE